jgi:hypothetical protein
MRSESLLRPFPARHETVLRFYIHASANAEQRIGAMMNARWTSPKASGKAKAKAAPKAKAPRMLRAA